MKQDDFERLKAICEKEGFECSDVFSDGRVAIIEKKKDPWEGVEFVECLDYLDWGDGKFTKGKIYPVKKISKTTLTLRFDDNNNPINASSKKFFKPSTETAYVEQLKKEAFERFGEIKEGDRVDFTNVGFPKQNHKEMELGGGYPDWKYLKESDKLLFYEWVIYQQGKWAERVNYRVSVEWDGGNIQDKSFYFMYDKKTEEKLIQMSFSKAGEFLASQLEKYLNGEIE